MNSHHHLVYIGLGSNLDNPAAQISAAIKLISQIDSTTILAEAKRYRSKPVGPQDQPDFVNTAILIATKFTPEALLQQLQQIEINQGRIKHRHWGERCIDLDILLFDEQIIHLPHLTIPHAELIHRDFVLRPLLDITPDLRLPSGDPLAIYLNHCQDNQLIALE